MAENAELESLRTQNDDLVGYIQDYQQQLVESQFAAVQARGLARKAENALAIAEARIAELESEAATAKAAPASTRKAS